MIAQKLIISIFSILRCLNHAHATWRVVATIIADRNRGYSLVDLEAEPGFRSIAVPIRRYDGGIVAVAQKEFRQIFPKPGWVEHDPIEIRDNVAAVVETALREADLSPNRLAAVGITNQRASTIVWDRSSGLPIAPGLGWQDLRTVIACITAKAEHGLALAPNQTATKAAAARSRRVRRRLHLQSAPAMAARPRCCRCEAPCGADRCLEDRMTKAPAKPAQQLLHLVFGGELDDVDKVTFKDLEKLDVVGFYPDYASAPCPVTDRLAATSLWFTTAVLMGSPADAMNVVEAVAKAMRDGLRSQLEDLEAEAARLRAEAFSAEQNLKPAGAIISTYQKLRDRRPRRSIDDTMVGEGGG